MSSSRWSIPIGYLGKNTPEIARKKAVSGSGTTEFISLSRDHHEGQLDRYKSSISIPDDEEIRVPCPRRSWTSDQERFSGEAQVGPPLRPSSPRPSWPPRAWASTSRVSPDLQLHENPRARRPCPRTPPPAQVRSFASPSPPYRREAQALKYVRYIDSIRHGRAQLLPGLGELVQLGAL